MSLRNFIKILVSNCANVFSFLNALFIDTWVLCVEFKPNYIIDAAPEMFF